MSDRFNCSFAFSIPKTKNKTIVTVNHRETSFGKIRALDDLSISLIHHSYEMMKQHAFRIEEHASR